MTAPAGTPNLLAIARVSRAHGLRGELRIEPYYDGSDALAQVPELWLSESKDEPIGAKPARIEWARPVPKAYLVKLFDVSDRNAAEALRGRTVWVDRALLPVEDESEYYLVDLIGAKVVGPEGEIGTVVEIMSHPSVDSLVISTADGRSLEQPLVPDWILRVSVAEKLVELATLDGLIG